VHAVENVSLTVAEGETIGSLVRALWKSVTMLSVMGLIPSPPGQIVSGEILFDGHDMLKMSNESSGR